MKLQARSPFVALALSALLVACSDEGEVPAGATTTAGQGGATATGAGGSGSGGGVTTSAGGHGGATTSAGGHGGAGHGGGGQGGAGVAGHGGAGGAAGGGGAGTPCSWQPNANGCGAGFYCDGCAGACAPVPAKGSEQAPKQPVCGCDGVTYWNASVAASHAVGVASAGACSPGKTCAGFGNIKCPAGLYCNISGPPNVCQIADVGGTCWGMPETCTPEAGFGPQSRACNAAQCEWECDLVKKGAAFEIDGGCPK